MIAWKPVLFTAATCFVFVAGLRAYAPSAARANQGLKPPPRISIPVELPPVEEFDRPLLIADSDGRTRVTTINPKLQMYLTKFLRDAGNPIAAVVVVETATGNILAMVQGRPPAKWGSAHHSAIYAGFPAASLFKTVVSAAGMELGGMDGATSMPLWGGCADVRSTGVWMRDDLPGSRYNMTLRRAYGQSCNGYFAKIIVNHLGLSPVVEFAKRLGWDQAVPADFATESSPLGSPAARSASVHTVGRFGAGFGRVGTSAAHVAWLSTVIANDGVAIPLRLFANTPLATDPATPGPMQIAPWEAQGLPRMISAETAANLRDVSIDTVRGGTASFAFRRGRHARIRHLVGGKTGTLSGKAPVGINTWFAGYMPVDRPEIAVAAVVVLEDLWHIKGPNLAAEAFWAYHDLKNENSRIATRMQGNTLRRD